MESQDWQSSCIEKNRVYNELVAMSPSIKSLSIRDEGEISLGALKPFSDLENLVIRNCRVPRLYELFNFPKLKSLTLSSAGLKDLNALPPLDQLKTLILSENQLGDLKEVGRLRSLEILDVTANSEIRNFNALRGLTNLKVIKVGSIGAFRLEKLRMMFPNVRIESSNVTYQE
jgi:hypothetical protein